MRNSIKYFAVVLDFFIFSLDLDKVNVISFNNIVANCNQSKFIFLKLES